MQDLTGVLKGFQGVLQEWKLEGKKGISCVLGHLMRTLQGRTYMIYFIEASPRTSESLCCMQHAHRAFSCA
jgi:hypothetical protein